MSQILKNQKINDIFFNLASLYIYAISIVRIARKTIYSDQLQYSWYSFSELLISYPERFTRRGFIGELASVIDSDQILFDDINRIIFINFIIFAALSFTHIQLYKLKPVSHFIFLISIVGIFDITLHNQYFHRKEIFILNLFMLLLLILKLSSSSWINLLTISFFSILMILIHEGIALITVPFIFLIIKRKNKLLNYQIYIYIFVLAAVFLIVVFTSGSESIAYEIWENVSEFDKKQIFENTKSESTAITAIGYSIIDSFLGTTLKLIFSGYMFVWAIYILILFWTFIEIFNIKNPNISTVKKFLMNEKYFFIIIPLFVVGFDWGRWILSLFYLCFITYLFLSNNDAAKNKIFSKSTFFLVVVSLLTVMPECCLPTGPYSTYYKFLKNVQFFLLGTFS
jgi:hypothetical protein